MNKTQNVVFKKVLTMLMAVMMVFTMMPSMAWADDSDSGNDVPSTTETITVYMTVSDQGKLALGKDSTVMAWVPVEVPASGGTASLHAVLQALHETYYADGSSGYAVKTVGAEASGSTEEQTLIQKFWGQTGTTRIFRDKKLMDTDINMESVTQGSYLLAAILADAEGQSDFYTQYGTGDFYDVNMAIGTAKDCAVKGYSVQEADTALIYPQAMPLDESRITKGFMVDGVFKPLSEMSTQVTLNQSGNLVFREAGEYLFTTQGTVKDGEKDCTIIPFPIRYVITEKPIIENIVLKQKNEQQTAVPLEPAFDPDMTEYTMLLPDYVDVVSAEITKGANCENKRLVYRFENGIHEGLTNVTDKPENLDPRIHLEVGVYGKNADADVTYTFTPKSIPTLRSLRVDGAMDKAFNRDVTDYHVYVDESKPLKLDLDARPYSYRHAEYSLTLNGEPAQQGENTFDLTTYDWEASKTMTLEIGISTEEQVTNTYRLTLEKMPKEDTPRIIYQPQDASYTLAEKTAEPLTVTASANGELSYQWYQNSANSKEGASPIENATTASYVPDISREGTTYYYCRITNQGASANNVTESEIAAVLVEKDPAPVVRYKNPIPELTEEIADGNKVYTKDGKGYVYSIGDKAESLKVEAEAALEGGSWSYQWVSGVPYTEKIAAGTGTFNNIKQGRGTVITDAVDASYQPPTAEVNANCFGTWYVCKATYTYKGRTYTAISEPVYVFVKANAAKNVKISREPVASFKYQVGTAKMTALNLTASIVDEKGVAVRPGSPAALNGVLSYQWYKNTTKSTNGGTPVDGAAQNRFTPPAETEEGVVYYYCVVTNTFQKLTRSVTSKLVTICFVSELVDPNTWSGIGTEEDPYLIGTEEDLNKLAAYVTESKVNFEGCYFKLKNDIELSNSWKGIGAYDGQGGDKGAGMLPFSGTLDGDGHRITFPYKGNQLFNYVRNAAVKNLKIKAPYIDGNGLVKVYTVDYGETGVYGDTIHVIDIDNVTIESGSTFSRSGFIGGYASGIDIVRITNCKAEAGVKVGWDAEKNKPAGGDNGTFAGEFNGYIANCESAATVYGDNYVGGIVAAKGQTMGPFEIANCKFTGEVIASGNFAGGIAGGGYSGTAWGVASAPNTPCATIKNCLITGKVSGADYVGGITGGEEGVVQCWANGIGYIQNNLFAGTLTCEGKYKGGIAGYINSLNCFTNIDDNYYIEGSASKGIGGVKYVDTSYASPDRSDSSVIYYNTKAALPKIKGVARKLHNRTDDPLGKDAEKLAKAVTAAELADGSAVKMLNDGAYSFKNWEQNRESNTPDIRKEAVAYKLELSGDYKKEYYVDEELDLTGAVFTLLWTNGKTTAVDPSEVSITGYDKTTRAVQYLTASYNGFSVPFSVTVILRPTAGADNKINVTLTILGDNDHGDANEKTGVHTLKDNNLTLWLPATPLSLDLNATVRDALSEAIKGNGITLIEEPYTQYGWYLQGMKKDSVEISEFTNGPNSGWMYTVNGTHPQVGGEAYFLKPGDKIVWHYTDDYTVEEGSDKWNIPAGTVEEEVKNVTTDTKTGTTTAPTEVKVSEKTNADGTKTKVAEVKVSAGNQKEVLKQAKASKTKEIILNVSSKSVGDATKAAITLDKSFIDSIVKDTDAKLTIKTPFGDKTYTKEELKAMSEAATGSTVTVAIEKKAEQPADDTAKAEKIAKAKSIVKNMKLVARSSKTAKKNIKAVLKSDAKVKASIKELKDLGFTVKYRFYRSTKKAASYKSTVTKKTASYTNTSGKKGTKYFYKVQVRVYDENGKLVAKTALKQCKYASRTWSKAR